MTDTAAEPLITSNDDDGEYERQVRYSEEVDDGDVDESALVSPGVFIWTLTLCAGISGLLFGYDTGVISSTLISINSDLSSRPLTTLDKSLITSATSFFALLASPLTGLLADAVGRKPAILAADLLFVLGAVWQAYATSVWAMIAGRSVVGAAVGSASFVVPLYISELSPSPFRGRLVTVSSLFITGGQVVAYLVGWAFSERGGGWRWMVGLGAVPAIAQFGMLFFMPETPRFLIQKGKVAEGKKVLTRVYGDGAGMDKLVTAVLRRVEKEILEEEDVAAPSTVKHEGSWKAKMTHIISNFHQLASVGPNRRALTIACMLQAFQQLCGFNSLMYFSATIFRLVGFHSPTLTSLSIAVTNFAFTLVAFWCIDRIGRRRILLLSVPVMVAGLALCAVAFSFIDLSGEEGASHLLVRAEGAEAEGSKVWPAIILLSMVIYVSSYAVGLGCVPWQQSELFPLSVRALGSALATSTNWFSNTIVGLTFLPMMEFLTPTGTFVVYAGVCVACWVTVWRIYPETAGLSLEDVGGLLREGFGVKESVGQFRGRRSER
ncbi:general substrate transporter [Macroventuria anomochaeta]|uniref:General substrate transporter n=1 Tax=Macroventuria anomochaeta TaxID=301207 RepID=A0ACB6RJV1_9PLEO|nr:general substrate transporter [Macroventuria anomochaeta]KAF2622235.1 general substrate transporter [Macroventuria anomochaeta]